MGPSCRAFRRFVRHKIVGVAALSRSALSIGSVHTRAAGRRKRVHPANTNPPRARRLASASVGGVWARSCRQPQLRHRRDARLKMPTATERLLGRTYRPPGYDPGDRPGYSPARSTRKRAIAADDIDIKVEEAPKPPPPAGARSWDVAKVASVVDECCEQC